MSISRQPRIALPADAGIDVRTFGVTFPASPSRPFLPAVTPGWHQLVHVIRGVLTVRAAQQDWLILPHRALWIPAGIASSNFRLKGEVAIRCLYVRRSRTVPGPSPACAAVNVTPLFRELIVRANSLGALDRRIPEQRRLIGVIRDELHHLPVRPIHLPIPRDKRALQFCTLLEATPPADRTGLAPLLRACGASRRTLERILRAETGISLGQWMRRHDLLHAVAALASGQKVLQVSGALGYSSPSAFIAMFKRELGQSPRAYFRQA